MPQLSQLIVVLLFVLAAPPLAAQSLGDASARERKKRSAQPPAAKVFTNTDLRKDEPPPAEPTADGKPGAPGTGSAAESGASEAGEVQAGTGEAGREPKAAAEPDPLERERQERKLLEAEWRMRFANAREQLALAEAACWREVVRTEFHQGIPVQMKVKEFVETEEFRRAKQALADLEEEFRRTGLPPGWAREP